MNVKVAKLDAERVYWGIEQKPLDQVKAGDVVFFAETFEHKDVDGVVFLFGDCDLPSGRYRWNVEASRFDPLPRGDERDSVAMPTAERALYELIRTVEARSPVSKYAIDWAEHYEKTLDALGVDLGSTG